MLTRRSEGAFVVSVSIPTSTEVIQPCYALREGSPSDQPTLLSGSDGLLPPRNHLGFWGIRTELAIDLLRQNFLAFTLRREFLLWFCLVTNDRLLCVKSRISVKFTLTHL